MGVQRGLLLGARKGPCGLGAAFLAKGEAQLLRWPQPVGAVGPKRRARIGELQRAEHVAAKEAVLTRHLLRRPRRCHAVPTLLVALRTGPHDITPRRLAARG